MAKICRSEDVRLIITTGDNIYAGGRLLGIPIGGTGDEDDDWFFTYFQPYRYIINRVPVYPSIGNHDAEETEERDDRAQVEDNFYVRERVLSEEAAGRASFSPGLFYRFRYGCHIEFVCIDTSKEAFFRGRRLFEYPKHWEFLELSFPDDRTAMPWRIPFGHHPPYCAGPQHHNTKSMQRLIPLFERSGVRVMFSGHEHNFQHSHCEGIDYFVTGAAGKLRRTPPDGFSQAHTVSWATECHFLLVRIEGTRMIVRAVGDIETPDLEPADITRFDPSGTPQTGPIEIVRE
jgi:tartrate-resistant acid phosphatase type 5